ncbi:GAF domain-containing sensor histidine kinase [Bacillus marinisedimentorum]|uniref:GAF domain-containing sensor histidine kinase n=1 Tax=Bacillus marinisedimentorum TaxID=1821260 RepID=UPI0007E18065|nr:GAF domain-containing sensor histidine kinase [Bacillus marinisedimentorum]
MEVKKRLEELETLKAIAETLNRGENLEEMLRTALKELLHVTGLSTGWIFLIEEDGSFQLAADESLPQALENNRSELMCKGTCWCLSKYNDGRLNEAVNIIECKRIEDAIAGRIGDTAGITHHATVPIKAGEEKFGLLNVAAPHKTHFTTEELALLEAVSLQIGTAVNRMKLFHQQQIRAELFWKLGEISSFLNSGRAEENLLENTLRRILDIFEWTAAAITCNGDRAISGDTAGLPVYRVEIKTGKTKGELAVYQSSLDRHEKEVIEQIARHVGITLENLRIEKKQREVSVLQERNRLARDLHDSVNQLLFSVTLTLRGACEMTEDEELKDTLDYVQQLSTEAQKEMRALIWQLRPMGLEKGLTAALSQYADLLGIELSLEINGVAALSHELEEAIWRIGQEALNNIKKHAGTPKASVSITRENHTVVLEVEDSGRGFQMAETPHDSVGIKSMKERAALVSGRLAIESEPGSGTKVTAVFQEEGGAGDD